MEVTIKVIVPLILRMKLISEKRLMTLKILSEVKVAFLINYF